MKYGYACVSTDDQSAALQLAGLKRAGCKTLFKDEGLSGATTKRAALLRCLKASRDSQAGKEPGHGHWIEPLSLPSRAVHPSLGS